tara:strand:- start:50 stop:559 length:510 start_codon:yes stop_codon:yes gene_type:complete
MSLIKTIFIIIYVFFISAISNISAEEIKKIGKYKDWEAKIVYEVGGKICFAQSSPVLQKPKSNKRNANLFVAFRPEENIKNEISVTSGYEFNNNTVTAVSGKKKFKFNIKEQGFAWIEDSKIELKMINRMKKGSRLMITGYDQNNSQTIDDYSLLGFTKAYNASKKACS